ncbi:hypothetical protein BDR22DRAFT_889716 [Usnea florida]
MCSWKKLAAWRPVSLVVLLALHTSAAIVRHPKASSSLGASELIARAEESATLEPYTGTGAVPTPKAWSLLSTQGSLQNSPTDSNITIRLTKENAGHEISSPLIYNLTVQGLAKLASLVVASDGDEDLPKVGQENSTFATSVASSGVQFVMTSSASLPVYAVADVLRGMQELTHYLLFLEFNFEVFSQTSPTLSPLASGHLGFFLVSFHNEKAQKRGLELVDPSAANPSVANSVTNSTTNSSIDTSRELLSPPTPIQLVAPIISQGDTFSVTYKTLKDALEVYDQSYADVATRILSNVTDLIIANHGDGLIPSPGPGSGRVLRAVDTWGSPLAVSLLPFDRSGAGFTLGQAATALEAIQYRLSEGPILESQLEIVVNAIPRSGPMARASRSTKQRRST